MSRLPFMLCSVIASFIFSTAMAVETEPTILVRSNPRTFRVESVVDVVIEKSPPSLLVIDLPIPSTNPSQEIVSLKADCVGNGVVRKAVYPETGLPYASATFQDTPIAQTRVSFEVVLYDVEADFTKIEKEYRYNNESSLYAAYTGASGVHVVPDHPKIRAVAEKLAKESGGLLDYARKAYIYVAENFKYINPNTGLHSLDKILKDGGGDCGNFSSVYVSLLRCHGIPARHVVGMRPDGSAHVWAEFYMEKYGWIPVDATFKNSNPKRDLFGKIVVHDPVVILSYGTNLSVSGLEHGRLVPKTAALMQSYQYWYHYAKHESKLSVSHRFRGELVETKDRASSGRKSTARETR